MDAPTELVVPLVMSLVVLTVMLGWLPASYALMRYRAWRRRR